MKKKNISLKYIITILLLSFLSTKTSYSEEKTGPTEKNKSINLSLGYGILLKNNIRKDNSYEGRGGDVLFNQLPLLQVSWGPVSLGQNGLSANIAGNRDIGGFINISRGGDRYKSQGLIYDRKDSWFFGGGMKIYKFDFLIGRDINGRSKGSRLFVHYNEMFPLNEKIFMRASVGLDCFNKSFAEYYYGVQAAEANATRSEYHPRAYCLPALSFFPVYKYSDNLHFMSGLSARALTKEVRQSPTTTGTWLETALILGSTWKF